MARVRIACLMLVSFKGALFSLVPRGARRRDCWESSFSRDPGASPTEGEIQGFREDGSKLVGRVDGVRRIVGQPSKSRQRFGQLARLWSATKDADSRRSTREREGCAELHGNNARQFVDSFSRGCLESANSPDENRFGPWFFRRPHPPSKRLLFR